MRIWYTFSWVLLLLLVVSCSHDELCYHHPHTAKARVDVDWSLFTKESPSGMTVTVYPANGGRTVSVLTHTLSHACFNLESGSYHTLTYNQSPSEFGAILFKGMDKYETAEVVSCEQASRWYKTRSNNERVVAQAEWLAADCESDVQVTDWMLEETQKAMKNNPTSIKEYTIAAHTPENIVYTVHVRVNLMGIYNLRSARAALDGMSEGYQFAAARYKDDIVTHLLEEWSLTVDPNNYKKGYIETTFYCFGLPESHQGSAEENLMQLSLLLVDNKTILNFPIQVGHKFEKIDEKELVLFLEIDLDEALPDVKPEGGSSTGFDVTVEDWGEEEDIFIPT